MGIAEVLVTAKTLVDAIVLAALDTAPIHAKSIAPHPSIFCVCHASPYLLFML
jgi:hypothetical protein